MTVDFYGIGTEMTAKAIRMLTDEEQQELHRAAQSCFEGGSQVDRNVLPRAVELGLAYLGSRRLRPNAYKAFRS